MGKKKGSKGDKQPRGGEDSKKSTDSGEASGSSAQQTRPQQQQQQDSGSADPSLQGAGDIDFKNLTMSDEGRDDRSERSKRKGKKGHKRSSEPEADQPREPVFPSQAPQGTWAQRMSESQMTQQPRTQPSQAPQGTWAQRMSGSQVPQQPASTSQGAWAQKLSAPQTAQRPPPGPSSQYPEEVAGPSGMSQHHRTKPPQAPQGTWAQRMGGSQIPQQPASTSQGAWGQSRRVDSAPGTSQQHQKERSDQRVSSAPTPSPQRQPKRGRIGEHETEVHSHGDYKSFTVQPQKETPTISFDGYAPKICAPVKQGRKISVITNHFPLTILDPNLEIFRYDVTMEPNKPKFLLRSVWKKCCQEHFPKAIAVFDGQKIALSRNPLFKGDFSATVSVLNPDSGNMKEFCVTIKFIKTIKMSIFTNFREKVLKDTRLKIFPEGEISILEIILKNIPADHLLLSGRVFVPKACDRPKTVSLSDRLTLINGFYQAVYLGYKLYLNFDVAHKALYQTAPVLDILNSFSIRRIENLHHVKPSDFRTQELNSFIRTMKVKYEIPGSSIPTRQYRVNKIVENAYDQTFVDDKGETMSVKNYYSSKGVHLRYPNLPLLWVGPTQRTIYIPMEFCRIAEDQIYRGDLTPQEQSNVVNATSVDAMTRRRHTLDQLRMNYDRSNVNFLREFGISVSGEMEKVTARVLDAPRLQAGSVINVRQGVWQSKDFMDPKSLTRWCIINLDKRTSKNSLMSLQNCIINRGRDLKMRIGDPVRSPLDIDSSWNELEKAFSRLRDMELVFVIIPDVKGVYSRVKTISETQEGVLTQCIKSRTIAYEQKMATTMDNILLKVNAKLGGKNHTLHNTSFPPCLHGNVMIVGADVTHSSPGSKMPSVAAVAVCCDQHAFQYSVTTRVQSGEMIKDLREIIKIHLREFHEKRKVFPDKIFIFRDGVSEGEMEKVYKTELMDVKNACSDYGCKPKITLLVVQKRHHTRFYPVDDADKDRNSNVPVGTCVDTDVVHPRDLDFYLVSHVSVRGTARPTRYRLLYDDSRLTDDDLEKLSFYLCHMFSRCKRSVSYPSPTYNAHLGAFRARAYLEGLRITPTDLVDKIQEKMKDNISKVSPMFFV